MYCINESGQSRWRPESLTSISRRRRGGEEEVEGGAGIQAPPAKGGQPLPKKIPVSDK